MTKFIFILGSPRKGNTDFILNSIASGVNADKEIILLRDYHIEPCKGCLGCRATGKCHISDDMQKINEKLLWADVLVIGSPNYFENVTGIIKNFMDRTHPLYETKSLAGKKIILIMVGGGKESDSRSAMDYACYGFVKHHRMKKEGLYAFKAYEANDLAKDNSNATVIKEMIAKLNSL